MRGSETVPGSIASDMDHSSSSDTLLGDLLFPPPAYRRTALGILTWWESRRLIYNIVVGVTGLVSLTFVFAIELIPPSVRGGAARMDVPFWWLTAAYALLANVAYTFGPFVEIAIERVWKGGVLPSGPVLFRQGLAFSVGLTLLPICLASLGWLFRVVRFLGS